MNAVINLGYRHLDTAWLYKNEEVIGEAIKDILEKSEGKITRADLFITTKIWITQYGNPQEELLGSLKRLGVDYVDLYLIHWPAQYFGEHRKPLHVLWAELEALVDAGYTKSLGLSNFNVQLICDLLCYARVKPVCNQVELHPYCAQSELVRFLLDQHIIPVAYCPLGRPAAAEDPGN